jgi:hypothetical protein
VRRSRLLFGTLAPDSTAPFLLLPDGESGDQGGGGNPPNPAFLAPPTAPAEPPAPAPANPATGYPENTAPADMTVEQQAAYWRARARQNEDKGKEALAWKAANESKVIDYDRLLATTQTEQEKALAAATAKAAADGRAQLIPQLVAAEFLAAAKGALTREQVAKILDPLDKGYFLAEDGTVDTAKVADYVSTAAPTAAGSSGDGSGTGGGNRWPGTGGQGSRGGGGATAPSIKDGADYYARMKNPAATTT